MKYDVDFSKYGNKRSYLGSISKKGLSLKEAKLFAHGVAIGLKEHYKDPYVHVSLWNNGVNNSQFEVSWYE